MYQYNRNCPCDRCRAHGLMAPAVLVTLGVLFLLQQMSRYYMEFGRTWPILLIVIGTVVLARRNASMEGHVNPYMTQAPPPPNPYASYAPYTPGAVPPPPNTVPTTNANQQPPSSEVDHG